MGGLTGLTYLGEFFQSFPFELASWLVTHSSLPCFVKNVNIASPVASLIQSSNTCVSGCISPFVIVQRLKYKHKLRTN